MGAIIHDTELKTPNGAAHLLVFFLMTKKKILQQVPRARGDNIYNLA